MILIGTYWLIISSKENKECYGLRTVTATALVDPHVHILLYQLLLYQLPA
jgi:hypothetical protein